MQWFNICYEFTYDLIIVKVVDCGVQVQYCLCVKL